MKPILSLFVTLGDGIVKLMHKTIMGTQDSLIHADLSTTWQDVLRWGVNIIAGIAAAVVFVLVTIATAGTVTLGTIITGLCVVGGTMYLTNSYQNENASASTYTKEDLPVNLYLPFYSLSPEEIFNGRALLFNVDFFNEGKTIEEHVNGDGEVDYYYYMEDGQEIRTSSQDMAKELRDIVSKWYVALRNIAIVAMMIVLLFIAIKILLSSTASDKAKYVQLLKDWGIGLILLGSMHYIMAFSNVIVNKIIDMISTSADQKLYSVMIPNDDEDKLYETIDKFGLGADLDNGGVVMTGTYDADTETFNTTSGDDKMIVWPTNLMGYLRLQIQLEHDSTMYISSAICFCVLVLFTIFFVISYTKRVIYMAFLTLIAPLIALTYPIDKITDGQAQGFDKWLKEYIFNLLIQPLHLLLYYILITSAFNLAGRNVIYSLIAIGFMMPAEKLLRSFFGFEKAHTPPTLGGAVGAGLTMNALSQLGNLGKGKLGKGSDRGQGQGDSDADNRVPRMDGNVDETAQMMAMGAGDEGDEGDQEQEVPPRQTEVPDSNDEQEEEEETDTVLERYRSEGYRQNPDGVYFNPWTDEYDANYDPHQDATYMRQQEVEQEEPIEQGEQPQPLEDSRPTQPEEQQQSTQQRQQQPTNQQQQPRRQIKNKVSKRTKAGRILRATGSAGLTGLKNVAKRTPGFAVKMAARGVGLAAGVTAGVIAGVAGGDAKQALTYVTTGAGLGNSIAGNLGNLAQNRINQIGILQRNQTAGQAFDQAYNSKHYDDIEKEKYLKQVKKDKKKAKKYFEANLDESAVKEILKDGGLYQQSIENNITDYADMATMYAQMHDDKSPEVKTVEDAIAVKKTADRIGDKWNDPSKRKSIIENYSNEYQENGMNQTQADRTAKRTVDLVTRFNKIKKKENFRG